MNPIPANLATEDELSEVTLCRIIEDIGTFAIGVRYRRGGYGFLKRTIGGWNRAAAGVPFIVLTDLDTHECPLVLLSSWLNEPKHPNLLFRVAVREIESWLLADRNGISSFLKVSLDRVPDAPDSLEDPKATLVDLAQTSRSKDIRERIVPRRDSTAKQGPDYNACLGQFVRGEWNLQTAMLYSPSLARSVHTLRTFTPHWPSS